MTWRITTEEVRDVVCANQAGQPPLPTPPRLTFLSQDDRFQVPNNRIPACAPSLHVHVWRFFAVLFTVSQRTGFCPCLAPTCVRLQLQTFRFCLCRTYKHIPESLSYIKQQMWPFSWVSQRCVWFVFGPRSEDHTHTELALVMSHCNEATVFPAWTFAARRFKRNWEDHCVLRSAQTERHENDWYTLVDRLTWSRWTKETISLSANLVLSSFPLNSSKLWFRTNNRSNRKMRKKMYLPGLPVELDCDWSLWISNGTVLKFKTHYCSGYRNCFIKIRLFRLKHTKWSQFFAAPASELLTHLCKRCWLT